MEPVDSYRYLDKLSGQMVKTWIKQEEPRAIPWTPLTKPVSDCTVASPSKANSPLIKRVNDKIRGGAIRLTG